jgi:hypothetical protein
MQSLLFPIMQMSRLLVLASWLLPGALRVVAEPAPYAFTPMASGHSVRNPLAGWRGKREIPQAGQAAPKVFTVDPGFESVKKWYVGWNELETCESDGVQHIREVMDALWQDLPARNETVIPRLVLVDARGSYVPADLPPFKSEKANWRESPWYTQPVVKARIQRLIARLGEVWDHDPRVACVEMGIQGKYAEHWGLAQMPEFAMWMSGQFTRAFQHKKVLFRSVGEPSWGQDTAVLKQISRDFPFGFYQDSFGFDKYKSELTAIAALDRSSRWKDAMMSGEIRTEGNPLMTTKAADNLRGRALTTLLDWTRIAHTSSMGWDHDFAIPAGSPGGEAMRAALGYHLVITRYQQPLRAEPGGMLDVSFSVKNTGSAPFYYPWPVQVALVDERTRQTVFAQTLPDDIRQWLPGTGWDSPTQAYRQAPPTCQVSARLKLPADLPVGAYLVTLAILNAEGGNLPAVRFEIQNYWAGGLHPMGRLGVGMRAATPVVDAASFFTLPIDPAVHYLVGKPVAAEALSLTK